MSLVRSAFNVQDINFTPAGDLVLINSTNSGNNSGIVFTKYTIQGKFLAIQDLNATGNAIYNSFTGSGSANSFGCVNNGNNLNWNFLPNGSAFIVFF
jgi:hypothetical protein